MNKEIIKAAYELGFTAGQMAGYGKALEDMRKARGGVK